MCFDVHNFIIFIDTFVIYTFIYIIFYFKNDITCFIDFSMFYLKTPIDFFASAFEADI